MNHHGVDIVMLLVERISQSQHAQTEYCLCDSVFTSDMSKL